MIVPSNFVCMNYRKKIEGIDIFCVNQLKNNDTSGITEVTRILNI